MTAQLQFDPATSQKRMGDGFYEQKLVREQVQALTGQRFLGDYANDEAQYMALMNNGLTTAKALQLRPGIALSATQVAQLTSDMVWLVTQEVTLADGSKQSVLVPQVYVRVQPGDVDGTGALLAGKDVQLNLTGDATNNGTIAGRNLVSINAQNIKNLGGQMSADTLALQAAQDIDNIGGQMQAQSAALLSAGRDINMTTTTQSSAGRTGASTYNQTGIDRVAGLYVSGPAGVRIASAGRDINLTAAQIQNTGTGTTSLSAANNLNLNAVKVSENNDTNFGANRYLRTSQSQEVGTQINAGGALSLQAGQDISAKAASVSAGQALNVSAGRNIEITAGQSSQSEDIARQTKSSGFLSKSATTTRTSTASTTAVASNLEGASVSMAAGQDLSIKGSNVLAGQSVNLSAGRNASIEAAQNTSSSSNFTETKKSGLMSGGGLSITIGKQQQSLDQGLQQSTAAASTVGSTDGSVTITAGGAYTQTGSDVLTPGGNTAITAQKVDINEARETGSQSTEQKFKQSGLTLAITSPVLSALQTASSQLQAAGNTSSGRMQALAGANAAFNLKQAADALKAGQGDANGMVRTGAQNPDGTPKTNADGTPETKQGNAADKAGGIGISLSVGSSSSQSKQSSSADNARGSSINAGGNITIQATGAGKDSNLTVQGSSVQATGTTRLQADNQVNLLAAQNTTSESSSNQSKSGSVGVAIQLGNGGGGMGFTASASKATGQGAGNSTTYTNTQVAGNTVNIDSGGDTTLKGAVVKGDSVQANVGGDLKIESLQDTNQYIESSKSAGGSIMVGAGVSGSINLAKSSINSNYQSVGEQSAIRAGDGGFQVNVEGKTTLTGAQITSTQAAIDNNKNSFQTGGTLTTTDLQNTASYEAKSVSVGLGAGALPGKSLSAGMSGVGFGSDSGNAASTSTAGISGVAGNTAARTGDKETGIGQVFDKEKVKAEVSAQVAITSEFGKQASKAVGDYAQKQYDKALASGDQAGIDAWKEGGTNRVALHAVVGGLTGGVQGAVGAGAASAAAPVLDDLQGQLQQGLQKAGLNEDASKLIASVASGTAAAGIGATASGGSVSGGATAFNADMNNRQIGQEERRLAQSLASKAKVSGLTKPDGSAYTQAEIENAMRNSGKGSESITQGMKVDPNNPNAITDKGAVWTSNDGKTLVQVNKDGSNLNPITIDPKLAAYIVQETGGANTPYKDLFNQLELAKSGPAVDPNASIKMKVDPNWNYMGANSAGLPSGTAKVPDGSYGVGLYPGITPGGEVEVEVKNGSVVGAKVGVGFGVGGHLNLGTQSVGGGLLKGPVSGSKGDAFFESNPQQSGEARVGASASVNMGAGTVGLELGASAGKSVNDAGVSNYKNLNMTPTIAPVIPKISAEIKVNVIEFSVKSPGSSLEGNSK